VAVHGLCRSLVARGHAVTVYTTNVHGAGTLPVTVRGPVRIEGVEVRYFPVQAPRRLYRSPTLRRALRGAIGDFDVVHLHSLFLWPTWAAARAAEEARVPYLVAPRGMLVRDLVSQRGRLRKLLWIRLVERRTIQRAAGLHVTSQLEAREAEGFGLRLPEVFVVPNGVEAEPLRLRDFGAVSASLRELVEARPFFLYLGRLSWKKNLDRLVAALPHASGAELVLAGPDDEQLWPALQRQAADAGVGARVHWVGPVAGEDKAALFHTATALLLPSSSENFGNAALEAMAVGCPVVVSAEVGLAPVVAESGAGLVAAAAAEPLAEAMRLLLAEPERRAEMRRRGPEAASRFSWPEVAREMEAAYERMRQGAQPRRGGPSERADRRAESA
jgi:glycosyltransferase involved in cell wall biosynthesis